VQDRRDNSTRFVVLGGEAAPPSGHDLTSLVFTVRKAESGALHRLLDPFARHGVNLTSIQSRPMKGAPWEYLFFIDVEGHRSDPAVQAALAEASKIAHSSRVLGSFPRAAAGVRRGAAR
jgi:chorismate mutase/prephenate dehydratase